MKAILEIMTAIFLSKKQNFVEKKSKISLSNNGNEDSKSQIRLQSSYYPDGIKKDWYGY